MKNKDIRVSNIKGLLIFLVVFGHIIEQYSDKYNQLFVFIYAFHMPLFVFISGYLAKRVKVSKVINLILLYFIFQTFFNWYKYFLGHYETFPLHYGVPQFHLWYIVSLGFWYAVALCILKLRLNSVGKWATFITIFVICFMSRWFVGDVDEIVAEYYENFSTYTLSYLRTLSFAPFFFAGFFMNKKQLDKVLTLIGNLKAKLLITFSFFIIVFLYVQENPVMEVVFRGSFGVYKFLEPSQGFLSYSMVILLHYIIASGISMIIISFINDKYSILTKWGDYSLTIFLFHPVFVFLLWKFNFFINWKPDTQFLLLLSITVGITYVLGSESFVKVTKYICNPYRSIKKVIVFPLRNNNKFEHQS